MTALPPKPEPGAWDWRAEEWSPPTTYWVDPYPEFMGMLSSDLIIAYNEALDGRLILPFSEENLKPAAYEMTLGPLYYLNGEQGRLTEERPWLSITPNSIVFVSMAERISLPHYIAARFDLAIEFIYQGILLGTGPQVDPGFQGVLSCPLHNISDGVVNLRLGYPFAKIDFAKTSGLACGVIRAAGEPVTPVAGLTDEADLYRASELMELAGVDGRPIKLFNKKNRWREPIFAEDYTGNRSVRSSLGGLDDRIKAFGKDIDEVEEETSRTRRFGLAAGIAVIFAMIAILITLAQLDRSYTDTKVDSVRVQPSESARRLDVMRLEILDLKRQVTKLEREIRRSARKPPAPVSP